jgi:hypothetical protein
MGEKAQRSINDNAALEVLEQAGLKEEIMQMQKLNLNDPAQSVKAQETLDQLLPKINQAFEDAGPWSTPHRLSQLTYTDPGSGDTIKADQERLGGTASLNTVIEGFAKQNAGPAPVTTAPHQNNNSPEQKPPPVSPN